MKKLILCFILTVFTSFMAFSQYFQWAKSQQGVRWNQYDLAAGTNFLAETGTFYTNINLGGQILTSPDSLNAFLSVSDLSGNVVWAKHIVNNSHDPIQVVIDQNQNILVSGIFNDSLYIGSLLFKGTTPGAKGVFLAKFDSGGNLLWSRSSAMVTTFQPFTTSISTDGNGNIFVAGAFNGAFGFGSTNFSALGSSSKAFLVKYDSNGSFQWGYSSNIGAIQTEVKVKAAPNGEAFLFFLSNGPIGPQVGISMNKLAANGSLLWGRIAPTPALPNSVAFDINLDLAVDNQNNAYLTGSHTQGIDFINQTQALFVTGSLTTKNIFIAKINNAGIWKWATQPASTAMFASGFYVETPSIFIQNDKLAISGSIQGAANFPGNLSVASVPFNAMNSFIASLDTAGTFKWVNLVKGTNNQNSGLTGDAAGNFYLSGSFYGPINFNNHSLNTNAWVAKYLAKISNNANEVSGTVFLDQNSNGIQDATELVYEGLQLETSPDPLHAISLPNGAYKFHLPAGQFSISIPNKPKYYTVAPAVQVVNLAGFNQQITGKDFALQPVANQQDVRITVTNLTPARPGFTLKYKLTYQNIGTTTLSDSIQLNYDAAVLAYTTATLNPALQLPGKLKWHYQNLLPNEKRDIEITLSVPATTALGTNLQAIATIKPISGDLFLEDNRDTLKIVVTGSYDPNDKQVDKETLTPAQLADVPYLDYIIRFQNMGTDTAFTVVVTDPLSKKLNLSTLEVLSTSHPYKMTVNDGNAEWRFDNIRLPHSTQNEPASHGFIRYRLKPKNNLVLGDEIKSRAAIYFDFNAPVMTNYAVTRIANLLGAPENGPTNIQTFKLYPNPARNYVIVASEFKRNATATVYLINMLGQTLSKVTLPANNQIHYQMPLKDLPKGVYLIRLETEAGMQTQRLVIQ